jgi:hypothetical protein
MELLRSPTLSEESERDRERERERERGVWKTTTKPGTLPTRF